MYSLYVFLIGRRLIVPFGHVRRCPWPPPRFDRSGEAVPWVSRESDEYVSLELQVGLEPVPAALAAEPRLLVAAERRGGIEAVVGVGPDHARAQALRHPEDAGALVRPHARGQPVRRVVGLLDRLLRRPEREHREHRPEDLLLGDAIALGNLGEDRRGEPVALLGQPAGRLIDLCPLLLAGLDQLLDLLELLAGVDGPDVGVLVERISDTQRAH